MFKAVCLYRIDADALPNADVLESALHEVAFTPCGATEPLRVGWVPALADDAALFVQIANGMMLVRLREQRRLLPASVLRDHLDEEVKKREEAEGRPLGRKEKQRMKDDLTLSLLPRAFPKTTDTLCILAPAAGWVIVGTSSYTRAELLLSALRLAIGSLPARKLAFKLPIPAALTAWASGKAALPDLISVGDTCELTDQEGVVRCRGLDLSSAEVQAHIEAGREVTKLALNFEDSIEFVLGHDARLTGLKLAERLLDEQDSQSGDDYFANLDAEWQLWGMNLLRLLPRLADSLGEGQRQ